MNNVDRNAISSFIQQTPIERLAWQTVRQVLGIQRFLRHIGFPEEVPSLVGRSNSRTQHCDKCSNWRECAFIETHRRLLRLPGAVRRGNLKKVLFVLDFDGGWKWKCWQLLLSGYCEQRPQQKNLSYACVKNCKQYVRQEVRRIKTTFVGSQEHEKVVLSSMFGSLDLNLMRHHERVLRKEMTFIEVWFHPFQNPIKQFLKDEIALMRRPHKK